MREKVRERECYRDRGADILTNTLTERKREREGEGESARARERERERTRERKRGIERMKGKINKK